MCVAYDSGLSVVLSLLFSQRPSFCVIVQCWFGCRMTWFTVGAWILLSGNVWRYVLFVAKLYLPATCYPECSHRMRSFVAACSWKDWSCRFTVDSSPSCSFSREPGNEKYPLFLVSSDWQPQLQLQTPYIFPTITNAIIHRDSQKTGKRHGKGYAYYLTCHYWIPHPFL